MKLDADKESLSLHYLPAQFCMNGFMLMILAGYFKWQYQKHVFHFKRLSRPLLRVLLISAYRATRVKLSRQAIRAVAGYKHKRFFLRETFKSTDSTAGSMWLGCRHDETISNKAAQIWDELGFASPLWVIGVKTGTERVEEQHLEKSKEACRPPLFPPPKSARKARRKS